MSLVNKYILGQLAEKKIAQADAELMLQELQGKKVKEDHPSFAIIGIAGRFPKSDNLEEFWNNLINGVNCIGKFPAPRIKDCEHLLKKECYVEFLTGSLPPDFTDSSEVYNQGGFLSEIDKFDAGFFGIPPREAKYMDPAQRVFLETAYEAIEDAGYGGQKIYGTKTAVFVGRDTTNIPIYRYMTKTDPLHLTGSWEGILASRVSYIFNLQGPALVIDTACSSGLTAVHMACQSIKNGECEMAIAGGINITTCGVMKGIKGPMDLSSVESSDDRVKTFDKDASGTVWSEGVGVIFIKPLSKALKDGDHIHAVIKGSALNNDGASNGITAPSAAAQQEVLVRAWKEARINPETINYVEAHGTGTVLGDPIETKGLTNAFREYTDKNQFCGIGSLKTNMGHMVAASGMASLLKVVLALKHQVIPPTINFENPNPYISFVESPLYVNSAANHWGKGVAPRRAGVNSFGFSGTNCHMVLEEAPDITGQSTESRNEFCCLTLSAKSEGVLTALIEKYRRYLQKANNPDLESICYTSNLGRGHYSHRLAVIAESFAELQEKFSRLSRDSFKNTGIDGVYYGEHKVVTENKKNRDYGEITTAEKSGFTKSAAVDIQKIVNCQKEVYLFILKDLCGLYVKGADIAWEQLYTGRQINKESLPAYPFERVRYWAEPKQSQLACRVANAEGEHPLLQRLVADSIYNQLYETEFSVAGQWVLSDHKIMGNCVVPGTTYLEIAREAGNRFYKSNHLEFKDLVFLTPLLVKEDERKNVQTILKKEDDYVEFVVASKLEPESYGVDSVWIKHVEGKIYKNSEAVRLVSKVNEIKNRCKVVMNDMELNPETGVFEFGPRWFNLKDLFFGTNEVLARVELSADLQGDLETYFIHPAMLDNAVNVISQSSGEGTYLPFSYKSFRIFDRMPGNFFSHVRKKENASGNKETITYDITLMDPEGKVFVEISDYTIKKVHQTQLKFKELAGRVNTYYEMAWIKRELPSGTTGLPEGTVLVFKDKMGTANQLIDVLKQENRGVIAVESGDCFATLGDNQYQVGSTAEDYEMLIEAVRDRDVAVLFHLFTLDDACPPESLDELEATQQRGLYSLFHLTRAIINKKLGGKLRLVLVSCCANEVEPGAMIVNPHNATLMGIGKVVGQEYSNLNCRFIDVDETGDARVILKEAAALSEPYAVAYRNGVRYVEQLSQTALDRLPKENVTVKADGVYLITGGIGGLGLEIAKYLTVMGKVNLALVNRSHFPERNEWESILQEGPNHKLYSKVKAIVEMEGQGAKISCYSADVADSASVKELLTRLRGEFGRINGIIHSAGVAGNGFIMRKDETTFKNVVRPKVQGTWLLDRFTREDSPDFFVTFSSITTIFGGAGQSDYTAANSYLDSFAAYRNQLGLKTISVNWPAWREVGMAVDNQVSSDGALFKSISTIKALDALEEIMNSGAYHLVPGDLNHAFLAAAQDGLWFGVSEQIMAGVRKEKTPVVKPGGKKEAQNSPKVVLRGKGEEAYTETENVLGQIWSQVLELSQIDVYETFHALGGDSILATHLLKAIESVYPGAVDISDVFSYPSIVQMGEYIDSKAQKSKQKELSNRNKTEKLSENQLKGLLDSLESGDISIENALENLSK